MIKLNLLQQTLDFHGFNSKMLKAYDVNSEESHPYLEIKDKDLTIEVHPDKRIIVSNFSDNNVDAPGDCTIPADQLDWFSNVIAIIHMYL